MKRLKFYAIKRITEAKAKAKTNTRRRSRRERKRERNRDRVGDGDTSDLRANTANVDQVGQLINKT